MRPAPADWIAPSSRAVRALLAITILAATLLAASTWRVYGHTWDEPEHLAAGMELLDRGKYEYDVQHPPLARLMIALGPYLAGARSLGKPPPDGTPEGVAILYGSGHYDLYLTLARLGTLPFLALLLGASWLWARRVNTTDREALLAVVLLAAVPPVLGHAALATLDVPATATTLLALYAAMHWIASGRWLDTLFFGLAAGLAVVTKLSAIPFIGVGLIVMWGMHAARRDHDVIASHTRQRAWPRGPLRRAAELGLVACVAGACVVSVYGGRFVYFVDATHPVNPTLNYLFGASGPAHAVAYAIAARIPLPDALRAFVDAVRAVIWHNSTGHLSFLLGSTGVNGWWYFYVVALAAKTPLPMLLTAPVGLAMLVRGGWTRWETWRIAPGLIVAMILGFASFYSHINIGIRHVLILYPFMAMGSAHCLAAAWRRLRTVEHRDWAGVGHAAVAGLIGWQVSTLASANPDYLPYFNEAVANPERVLVDSDLAWGQDVRRLERRLAELKVPSFSFAYLGTADLNRETFPKLSRLPPGRQVTGWVAITALARVHGGAGYDWLDAYAPIEKIGKSIDLYYIPEPQS